MGDNLVEIKLWLRYFNVDFIGLGCIETPLLIARCVLHANNFMA